LWVSIQSEIEPILSFKGRDVISARDFSREELELLFRVTDEVKTRPEKFENCLRRKKIALLFFEKSTRTRDSFKAAICDMGGNYIGFSDASISSVGKGESLRDTIRMYDTYSDLIILRHPCAGAAKFASEVARKPVINAGDGNREHPTQAMLDLYTIRKEIGRLDSIKIGIMGDLKYGRTGSSLSYALTKFKNVEIFFITPPTLEMREEVKLYLEKNNVKYVETHDPTEVISELDVLYVTRIQRERFTDISEYEKVRGTYVVDKKLLEMGKKGLKVMHPLPRVDEIPFDVDETPQAIYIGQAENGPYVRAALLSLILGVYHE